MSDSVTVNSRAVLPRGDLMAWLICLSAGLFFAYELFQLNVFDTINQSLRDDFHLNATQLSWMSSTYLWADILFLLPAGILLDIYSARKVILNAMALCILGTIGFALSQSFVLACFFHFISGIGNAFCFLSCIILVARWFSPKQQAFVIGLLVTMAFTGGMLAHTPFAWLNKLYGWRNALLIVGAVGMVILLWIYLFVQDSPNSSLNKKGNSGVQANHVFAVLKNSQVWFASFYTSFLNLFIMIFCVLWGTSYLTAVHHIPQMEANTIVNFIYLGSIIGCPLSGWFSDKQGRRKPIMLIGAVASLIALLPLLGNYALSQFELSCIFFALGLFSSTQVVSYPLIAESNLVTRTGAAVGIASIVIQGGGAFSQILFGWLLQLHAGKGVNHYTIADYQQAMRIFPIALAVAILCVLLTRESYCKHLT